MKQALSILAQTLVLLLAAVTGFLLGVFVPSVRLTHVLSRTVTDVRTYDFDWLAAVVLIYVLLLLIGVLRKRLSATWVGSTIALALAILIVTLFTKVGYKVSGL